MSINISYTHPEASTTSRAGTPVPLHAFGITSHVFNRGKAIQVSQNAITRIFTGVAVTIPFNCIGLISITTTNQGLSLARGSHILPPGFSGEISLELTSVGSMSLIEYGMRIADLYIVEIKSP